MAAGNECPECGENVGMRAIFLSSLPTRILCPHCKRYLRYGDTSLLIVFASFLTVTIVSSAGVLGWCLGSGSLVSWGLVFLVVVIVGLGLLEVAFVLLLWYGNYRLEPVNPPDEEGTC
jgi:hypothetical protein